MTQGIATIVRPIHHRCIDLLPGRKIFSDDFPVINKKTVAKYVDT